MAPTGVTWEQLNVADFMKETTLSPEDQACILEDFAAAASTPSAAERVSRLSAILERSHEVHEYITKTDASMWAKSAKKSHDGYDTTNNVAGAI